MKYRFARPCIILLCFALMVCESKAGVYDDLTVARALRDRGDFRETIAALKRIVMAPSTSTIPAEMAAGWNRLGSAYLATGSYSKARKSIEQALQIAKAAPENLIEEAAALDQLGLVYLEIDDKQALGDNDPITLSALVPYSRLLDMQGQHEQAAQLQVSAERSLHGRFGTPCTACDLYGRYPHS